MGFVDNKNNIEQHYSFSHLLEVIFQGRMLNIGCVEAPSTNLRPMQYHLYSAEGAGGLRIRTQEKVH